jgi:Fe-S-cluster containining protein
MGVFFDVAPLHEHEVPLAEKLHLPVVRTEHFDAFRLPCPRLDDKRCTIYETRPSACATYACGLLRRYTAGEVSLVEALAAVARVASLAGDPQASPEGLSAAYRRDLDP